MFFQSNFRKNLVLIKFQERNGELKQRLSEIFQLNCILWTDLRWRHLKNEMKPLEGRKRIIHIGFYIQWGFHEGLIEEFVNFD